MLNIKFIRENKKLVEDTIKRRRVDVSLKHLLEIDDKSLELIKTVDNIRRQRKEASAKKDVESGNKIQNKLKKQ